MDFEDLLYRNKKFAPVSVEISSSVLELEILCAVPSPKFCFEQLPYHLHFYHPNFLRLSTFDSSVNFPHVLERPKQRQKKTELIKSRKSKNLQIKNECQK